MSDVASFVLRHRSDAPERVAIDLGDSVVTYGELGRMVDHIALRLQAAGVEPGELIVLSASDELALLVGALAAASAGVPFALVRRSMPLALVEEKFKQLRPRFLLTDLQYKLIPSLRAISLDLSAPIPALDSTAGKSSLTSARPVRSNDPFCLIFGSGSTGKPKLFLVSHGEEIAHLETLVADYSFAAGDRVATFTHVEFTSARRRYFAALSAGCTVQLYPKQRTSWIEDVLYSEVSFLHVPVVTLHHLVTHFGGKPGIFRNLRLLGVGGSEVSEALRHETDRTLSRCLHVAYGTNELGFLTMARPEEWRAHPGTIGRPLPGIELGIVDKLGRPVPAGRPGLLRFRKNGMMKSYLDAPELTQRTFRDGWFYPFDVGSMEGPGLIRLLGRADDMMLFDGINIYPSEIEATIRALPGVRDVAAIPLRHAAHGDIPVCAVVLEAGASLAPEQILQLARRALGAVSPKRVFVVDDIPRDDQGKLLRPQLRDLLVGRLRGEGQRR